jgi:hypothetical protein
MQYLHHAPPHLPLGLGSLYSSRGSDGVLAVRCVASHTGTSIPLGPMSPHHHFPFKAVCIVCRGPCCRKDDS